MKRNIRKWYICTMSMVLIIFFYGTINAQAKTIRVRELTNSFESGQYIYYSKPVGIITSDLMRYNTKTKKVEKFIEHSEEYMSFFDISLRNESVYAISRTDGGTGNPVMKLIKIDEDTKTITPISNAWTYYYYHNKIYFEKYKERESNEFGIEMYSTGKICSLDLQKGDLKEEKNIKIKAKEVNGRGHKIKHGIYKYYTNNNGTRIYRKNIKTNKKKCIFKSGNKMRTWNFEVTKKHILIIATMKKYNQKYNTRMYVTDLKGKNKKLIGKWHEQ